jgi:DNA-binding NtrC family response regulator
LDQKNQANNTEKKKRILIIEDDESIIQYYRTSFLDVKSLEFFYFVDPTIALSEYRLHYYDMLIIDLVMPKLNGIQVYNELKNRNMISNEIICFTGNEIHRESLRQVFPKLEYYFVKKSTPLSIELVKSMMRNN